MGKIDFEEINSAAMGCLEGLLRDWLPGGRLEGNEYRCGSWAGQPGNSLAINIRTGKGGDFASGEMAGDPIAIYAMCFGVDMGTAAKGVASAIGMSAGDDTHKQLTKYRKLPPPPIDEDTDEKRQLKLDKIISECIPLEGTVAVQYLKNRMITGCDTNIFKFRPHPSGGGALVCIAKNEDGAIRAVQQIYLDSTGNKIHDPWQTPDKGEKPIKKRTNGYISGHPIRIPRLENTSPDTPVIVCEGPEDAMTLSLATGFEVWAACSLANISKIPYIPNKQFLIARDNDEPDSIPDKAINKAMLTLIDRGFANLLCIRAPEGIKDANELLQTSGMEAIVNMVNNAQPVRDYRDTELSNFKDSDNYGVNTMINEHENPIFETCSRYPHTDVGNAMRIKERWQNVVKWADGIGWIIYSKGKWQAHLGEFRVLHMAAITAIEIQNEIPYAGEHQKDSIRKWSKRSQGGSQINHALKLAKMYLAINSTQLDWNPFFFNCANGVIDLKTAKLLKHSSEYLLTKQSDVTYDPNAKCPTWERFLKDIFPEDLEIIPFIQRAVGYSLTGDTREQCMFILHGTGSNGKSTFLDTLQGVMADYWTKTKAEAVMDRGRNEGTAANPFITQLRGSRFVTASEFKSDRSLDESLIKEITGDEFISARNMYQAPIIFKPMFKLWMATNYKPEIRGNDEGIWRRLRLIPFKARFYDNDNADAPLSGPFKDKMLMIKLKAELPGILAWAVRGCMDWQKNGLLPPDSIKDATNEYRREMDIIGTFLEDCCLLDDSEATVSANDLYNVYKNWCEDSGHNPLAKNKFGRRLTDRNIGRSRTNIEKRYKGIKILEGKRPRSAWYR